MLGLVRAGAVVLMAFATHERARVWHDEVSLWTDTARKAPQAPRPLINLSRAIESTGDFETAAELALRATVLARRPSGFSDERQRQWLVVALTNEARFRIRRGQVGEPLQMLTQALTLNPMYALAQYEYQIVAFRAGRCTPTATREVWRCPLVPPSP